MLTRKQAFSSLDLSGTDAYSVRCRVPGHYEPCSERARIGQLKKYRQLKKMAHDVAGVFEPGPLGTGVADGDFNVVFQKSISTQIRQPILYIIYSK